MATNRTLVGLRALIRAGFCPVELAPCDKRPLEPRWSDAPARSFDQAADVFGEQSNVGFRLGRPSHIALWGYVHGVDCDLSSEEPRHARELDDAKRQVFGDALTRMAEVRSGSGGAHFYFLSPDELRTGVVTRSDDFVDVIDRNGREKRKRAWQIEIGSTGRQFVAPGSVHPETLRTYEWVRPFDLRNPPAFTSQEIEEWPGVTSSALSTSKGAPALNFQTEHDNRPPDYAIDEVLHAVKTVFSDPNRRNYYVEDREGWLEFGMMCHNYFQGSDEGLELWSEWSLESSKYDHSDLLRVWRSFGRRRSGKPVTMRKLVQEARRLNGVRDAGIELVEAAPLPPLTDPLFLLYELDRRQTQDARGFTDLNDALDFGEQGLKASAPNLALVLRHDPRLRGVVAWNEFAQCMVYRQEFRAYTPAMTRLPIVDPVNGDRWQDHHTVNLRLFLESKRVHENERMESGLGLKVTDRDLIAGIEGAARGNSFHPVRDYLDGLHWDGEPRIETWLQAYLGVPDSPYVREVGRIVMMGLVRRVREPGCKFDFVLTLTGPQGIRKSTTFEILARRREWFGELTTGFDDTQKYIEQTSGKWIIEIGEGAASNRQSSEQVKNMVTIKIDSARAAYGRYTQHIPRQHILTMTKNKYTIHSDATGARRFFPIEVIRHIDTEGLAAVVEQLHAEADVTCRLEHRTTGRVALYLRDAAAAQMALDEQADRKTESADDLQAARIANWLGQPVRRSELVGKPGDRIADFEGEGDNPTVLRVWVCAQEVFERLDGGTGSMDQRQATMAGNALMHLPELKRFGRARRDPWGRQRYYVLADATSSELDLGYRAISAQE